MSEKEEEKIDVTERDQIFLVQKKPHTVAVIYPKQGKSDVTDAMARPGVVEKTARMSKHRCRTCKGRDSCFHLNIFNQAKLEEEKETVRSQEREKLKRKTDVKTDLIVEDDTNLKDEIARKPKSKKENVLNPENFNGKDANVFGQKFVYPPTEEEKKQNNKINVQETLFPTKMMIPPGVGRKLCKCGNAFTKISLESKRPVIHHSKPTKDSRNSDLSTHFLETSECNCKIYYDGESDRLVRTSAAPAQAKSSVHFVSVDLLNEYMCTLFGQSQEGKSVDAFVSNKNHLNREERGQSGREISKKVFFKAFEIFLHATDYNMNDAFGCEKCPKELLKGETEDDFENLREVHISDGIDMGNQQYQTKGLVAKEMFSVPKVASGKQFSMLIHHNFFSTFLTIFF